MAIPRTALSPPSVYIAMYASASAVLLITALASIAGDIRPAFFCRDAMATLEAHPLTGLQSNLGVLVWCATAAICLFSRRLLGPGRGDAGLFLLCFGLFTALLTLDDLFLIHEDLLHRYLGSWAYGKALYLLYALFMGGALIRFRSLVARSEYVLLLLALLFFAAALGVEAFDDLWLSPWRIFWEDGFKLTGILTWCGYLTRTCLQLLGRGNRERGTVRGEG